MTRKSSPLWPLLVLIFAGCTLLTLRELAFLPDGEPHAYVLDVGQGDAILLVSPTGKQVLVDGGPDLSALEHLGKHLSFFDRSLDLVVLTHPNADHITAFPELLRRYHIENILFTGIRFPLARYDHFLQEVRRYRIPILLADAGQDIDLGDGLTLDILWPMHTFLGEETKDENNTSVVFRAIAHGQTFLLTGDIDRKAEEEILRSGTNVRADVLKVPHHGSRTSSSTGFLLALHPERAVISVGRSNSYGHPHGEVLDRLDRLGIPFETTAYGGTVVIW